MWFRRDNELEVFGCTFCTLTLTLIRNFMFATENIWNLSHPSRLVIVVVQWRQKDVQKSWCTCRHVVLPIKPIAFLRSRCRRRRRILKSLLTREVQSRGARGVMGRRNEGRHSFFYSFPSPLVLRSVKLLVFHPPRAIQIETTGDQSGIEQQARSGHSSFLSPVPS